MTKPLSRRHFLLMSSAGLATAACSAAVASEVPTPLGLLLALHPERDLMIAEYHHPDNWTWLGRQRDLWTKAHDAGYRCLSLEMKIDSADMVRAYLRGDLNAAGLTSYLQQIYATHSTIPWIYDDARGMAKGVVSTISAAHRAGLDVVLTDYRGIPPYSSAALYGSYDPYGEEGPVYTLEKTVRDVCLRIRQRSYIVQAEDGDLINDIRRDLVSRMNDADRAAYDSEVARRDILRSNYKDPLGNIQAALAIQHYFPDAPVIHMGGAAHILDGLYSCPDEKTDKPAGVMSIHYVDNCLVDAGRRFDSRSVMLLPREIEPLARMMLRDCLEWAKPAIVQGMAPDFLVQVPAGRVIRRDRLATDWIQDATLQAKLDMP